MTVLALATVPENKHKSETQRKLSAPRSQSHSGEHPDQTKRVKKTPKMWSLQTNTWASRGWSACLRRAGASPRLCWWRSPEEDPIYVWRAAAPSSAPSPSAHTHTHTSHTDRHHSPRILSVIITCPGHLMSTQPDVSSYTFRFWSSSSEWNTKMKQKGKIWNGMDVYPLFCREGSKWGFPPQIWRREMLFNTD